MKKLMGLGLVSGGLIFALACTPPPAEETDAGTARADAGTVADAGGNTNTDSGTATQDAGGNTGSWVADNYGKQCASDADCPGGSCIDLFQGQGQATCFKNCTDAATDCADFPYNPAGVQCAGIGGSANVCIIGSGQNGPCGNPLNATCTDPDYGLCGTDQSGVGSCVRICDPSDTTTCRVSGFVGNDQACGCRGDDHCSTTLVAFPSGVEDDPDGVCAPATTVGATCGFDGTTLQMTPCTDGQVCDGISQSNPTGSCAEPSPADAGMAEDAG